MLAGLLTKTPSPTLTSSFTGKPAVTTHRFREESSPRFVEVATREVLSLYGAVLLTQVVPISKEVRALVRRD
jgi:hypothetical protein